jgi:hypothetical protein
MDNQGNKNQPVQHFYEGFVFLDKRTDGVNSFICLVGIHIEADGRQDYG